MVRTFNEGERAIIIESARQAIKEADLPKLISDAIRMHMLTCPTGREVEANRNQRKGAMWALAGIAGVVGGIIVAAGKALLAWVVKNV